MKEKYLTLLKKIFAWRDHDTEKATMDPSRDWLVMAISFGVGLLCVAGGLTYFSYEIYRDKDDAPISVSAEKLDEKKMTTVLANYEVRESVSRELQAKKPIIVDPGI